MINLKSKTQRSSQLRIALKALRAYTNNTKTHRDRRKWIIITTHFRRSKTDLIRSVLEHLEQSKQYKATRTSHTRWSNLERLFWEAVYTSNWPLNNPNQLKVLEYLNALESCIKNNQNRLDYLMRCLKTAQLNFAPLTRLHYSNVFILFWVQAFNLYNQNKSAVKIGQQRTDYFLNSEEWDRTAASARLYLTYISMNWQIY